MSNKYNNNALTDSLFSGASDDISQSALKDSSEQLRLAREKAKRNQQLSQGQDEEEEEDEDEEDEEDDESGLEDIEIDEDSIDEEDKKKATDFLKKLLKNTGVKTLITSGVTIGGTGMMGLLLTSIYRVHYNGEFEFKGIGGEYQTSSYKNMNYTSFDKTGNVQLGGLSKENKLTKTYYTLYSDNSYYAVVEDSKKYKNIDDAYKRENLLTPDELREQYPDIADTEGREKMFQLNPDVLYSLDRYLHKNEFLYPQQFVKPVYYEESKDKFGLKMLTDDKGKVVTQSQVYNADGSPRKENGSLKKEPGIWDYGLASVLHYKEYEVKERKVTTISGSSMVYKGFSDSGDGTGADWTKAPAVGDEVSQTTINSTVPPAEHPSLSSGTGKETVSDKPAYAIDKAVTAGGTITSKVAQRWQEKAGTRQLVKKTSTITDTETKTIEKEKKVDLDGDGVLETVDEDGDGKPDTEKVEVTRTHNYEVTYTYETYVEEYVPYYEGDLDTSEIVGSQYYRQYIRNYSNYIPKGVPKKIDFSVLENEEVSELFVNDDPNAYGSSSGAISQTNANLATDAEFNNAVFMGDSLTVSMGENVSSITTFATGGHNVKQGRDEHLDGIIKKQPPVVVISYGTNDAGYNNTRNFIQDYKDLISKLKAGIPNVKIYINKIFPGDETKPNVNSTGKTIIKNIPSYNNALNQIASEANVTLIDCTNIPDLKSYYEKDGIHFKSTFYKLWYDEMKKKIVTGANTTSSSTATPASISNTENTNTNTNTSIQSRTPDTETNASLTLPPPREGEERDIFQVLSIGTNKDGQNVLKALKYLPIFEKYGRIYGIDPYLLVAKSATESGGNPNSFNGAAMGLMQIENTVTKVEAFNHETKSVEKVNVVRGNLFDPDYNIKIGTMEMAEKVKMTKYNVMAGIQGYNYGMGGLRSAIQYYLSGGTFSGSRKDINTAQVDAYLASNHVGWLTALYPGDLSNESKYKELDSNDGKHSARTWYSHTGHKEYGQGSGTPVHLDRVLKNYPGPGSPWVMDEDGQVHSVDGTATGYVGGSSSAIGAFNSFLSSNWSTILEKKDILFPWTNTLDRYLYYGKKDNYNNLKTEELIPVDTKKFFANMTSVDEDIILSMMFALNQGNYLSKYDFMGEAEWKAMYNQLLSSPTGKTWDDKWIGFNSEDVFGKDLDSLGTLFDSASGINPVISRKFGLLKNIYTEDKTEELTHYNETNFGIDITIPEGTEVLAVDNGTIIGIEKDRSLLGRYGNYIKIKYNSKTTMIISNLDSIAKGLKKGDTISKGTVLGKSGGKCKSYKDGDLHIELLYNGEFINPEWIVTRDMKGFEDPIQGNNNGGVTCGGSQTSAGIAGDGSYVDTALAQVGKPYVWGATGPDSFDCSGLVYYSMKQHGVDIVRNSKEQRKATERITFEQLQRGDLIFRHGQWNEYNADTSTHTNVSHVMIYIGNNQYVHAPSSGKNVEVKELKHVGNLTYGRYSALGGSVGTPVSSNTGCQTAITGNNGYVWPVPGSDRLGAPFGQWRDNNTRQHKGLDIGGQYPKGDSRNFTQPIVASIGGEVIHSTDTCPSVGSYGNRCGGGFGNWVKVKGDDGNFWIYPHLSKGTITVKTGDRVNQGQELGKMGSSGSSTGAHLHLEVRVGKDSSSSAVDPLTLVKP